MPYNRTDILNSLIHRINSFSEGYRQNIAIIGEQYIGKTSLIRRLLSSSEIKKDAIIPVYLEVKIEPFEFCVKRFIKAVLFQLLQSDPLLAITHNTVLLIEDLKRNYPKTAQICTRVLQDIEKKTPFCYPCKKDYDTEGYDVSPLKLQKHDIPAPSQRKIIHAFW
jgi:predicted ATPase